MILHSNTVKLNVVTSSFQTAHTLDSFTKSPGLTLITYLYFNHNYNFFESPLSVCDEPLFKYMCDKLKTFRSRSKFMAVHPYFSDKIKGNLILLSTKQLIFLCKIVESQKKRNLIANYKEEIFNRLIAKC